MMRRTLAKFMPEVARRTGAPIILVAEDNEDDVVF
jgi:hypothetical protein